MDSSTSHVFVRKDFAWKEEKKNNKNHSFLFVVCWVEGKRNYQLGCQKLKLAVKLIITLLISSPVHLSLSCQNKINFKKKNLSLGFLLTPLPADYIVPLLASSLNIKFWMLPSLTFLT